MHGEVHISLEEGNWPRIYRLTNKRLRNPSYEQAQRYLIINFEVDAEKKSRIFNDLCR